MTTLEISILGIVIGATFGLLNLLAKVLLGLPAFIAHYRKPKVLLSMPETYGSLVRHLNAFDKGWGVIVLGGKLIVRHQSVTIVDAELSFLMDETYTFGKERSDMGEDFPPRHVFVRVGNDEDGYPAISERERFEPIKLIPSQGEQRFSVKFTLAGNFATEYSRMFFDGEFSTECELYIPMWLRFQYEHNGKFYWTRYFKVLICPWDNKGWTKDGICYIDNNGKPVNVIRKVKGENN